MKSPILDAFLKKLGWRCEHALTWPRTRWYGFPGHRFQATMQVCVHCGSEFRYHGELVS